MMFLANRLRGTYGWFAAVFGLTLTAIMYLASGSWVIATLIGVGYWFGEMLCGWGDHIGNVTTHRFNKFKSFPKDGDAVGARWLTSMIVYPKLWRLHLANAKVGLWNIYPRTMNMAVKGWSIGRILGISVQLKPIEEFVINRAMTYNRVFLVIRGIYWWTLPMIGLAVLTGSAVLGVVGLVLLSFGWVVCAELGYYYDDKIAFKFLGMSFVRGWELQELFYGVWQTMVIGTLIWIGV